jgi:hypothetical protein
MKSFRDEDNSPQSLYPSGMDVLHTLFAVLSFPSKGAAMRLITTFGLIGEEKTMHYHQINRFSRHFSFKT